MSPFGLSPYGTSTRRRPQLDFFNLISFIYSTRHPTTRPPRANAPGWPGCRHLCIHVHVHLLHHDPRHSRGRLGGIDDLHHHDLQHHDLRHHDAVAHGDMLRWLQSASSLDLNCSDCHYSMAATLRQSLGSCSGPSDLRLYLRLQLLLCSHLSAATSGPTGLGCRSSSSSSSSSSSASSLDLHCSFFAAATLVAVLPCSGCAPTQSSVEQAAAGPSYACGYVLGYASVDSCFAAATSVQHLRCSPARSRDLHGSYFAAATSVRPLRGSAALSLEPDCSYIAVPLAEPVAMPPTAPPSTATASQCNLSLLSDQSVASQPVFSGQ